jgi:hypothetical protein
MTKKGYGELLKSRREEKNLKYPEVEKILKIDSIYLKAMEDEDAGAFEKPIYLRLFLKTYAKFLKLNVDEVLGLLTPKPEDISAEERKEIAKKQEPQQAKFKLAKQEMINEIDRKTESFESFFKQNNILVICAAAAGIIIIVLLFVVAFRGCGKAKPEGTKQVYTTPVPEESIKVEIKAKEDVWLKAKYGDKEEEYNLKKNDEKQWSGINKIVFLIGNAGGVEFTVNGDNIGVIGQEREVINGLVFEAGKNWYIDKGQGFKRMKVNSPAGETTSANSPAGETTPLATTAKTPEAQPIPKDTATVSP